MIRLISLMLCVLLCVTSFAQTKAQPKSKKPILTAKAWLVADSDGNILGSHNQFEVRSIASITKLMTAIVVLNSAAPLTERVGALYGRYMTREQLIQLAVVHSDNRAAKLLCETYPDGYDECIRQMNNTASELGMHDTSFTEPTGLFNSNVSTAIDLLKLTMHAANYPKLVMSSNLRAVELEPVPSKKAKSQPQSTFLNNTNTIVQKGFEFLVSKTGYIRASGGCIVMTMLTAQGWRTVILLGSNNTKTRLVEAEYLATKY